MKQNPANMTLLEITGEIRDLRKDTESLTLRIRELSDVLSRRVKKGQVEDESAPIYLSCARIWSRFAGMVSQGLARTKQADRFLQRLTEKEEPRSEDKKPPEVKTKPLPEEAVELSTSIESLLELYGEDLGDNAGR